MFTARILSQVVGRVISMTPVKENVSIIISKYCYMCIEIRTGWDNTKFSFDLQQVLSELKFWLDSIIKIN